MNAPGPDRPQPEEENLDLIDYQQVRNYAAFVLAAFHRRKLLVAGVFAFVVGGTLLALAVLPRTYYTETKILAQRNLIIAALGNPTRSMPWEADSPLRAATETVLRHDNLVSLVKQTDLVAQWPRARAPILRLKDFVSHLFRGPPSPEDQLVAMVGLLDSRLSVKIGEGTVQISIEWPDREMAYRLVEAAQQNFLEARHASEISSISEALAILESHALRLHEQIDAAAEQMKQAREASGKSDAKQPRKAAPVVRRRPRTETSESQELTQLRAMLDGKRRAIKDLEEFRKQRLETMEARLAEQKLMYSDLHPAVVDLQQRVESLRQEESSQILALRQEEREIEDQYLRRGGKKLNDAHPEATLGPLPAEIIRLDREAETAEDPEVEQARGELRFAMGKYANLLDRIDSATMELDTSRAAFKYRYSVIVPAEVPTKALRPNVPRTIIGGIIAALFLALFSATVADVLAGKVLHRWQIERSAELPVLGEVQMP